MTARPPIDESTDPRRPVRGDAEELAALGKLMGELVHDLSNEMTVLNGWALLARGELGAGQPGAAEIDRVLELSGSIGQMLRDVLDTVAGRPLSPEERFDPRQLTEETVARRVGALAGVEVRLRVELPAEVRVAGRASFWTRLLSNLLSNAGRHARREVRVSLGLEAEGLRVALRVEDDGPGIAAADRESVFQPLWHGRAGGTGLGLSSTLWAARQLGGEVAYEDGGELGGARFVARVPVARPLLGRVREPKPKQPRPSLEGLSLLLVDDDPTVLAALVPLLERRGAKARAVEPGVGGEAAVVSEIRRTEPDSILLDLRMGGRSGLTLWRRLREEVPHLCARVVFMSGAARGEPDWDEAEATGQPTLAKPFDLNDLAAAIARVRSPG